ncbi:MULTISPECIES: formate/nitrite transporter family protein [unclassified Haladaptatus]|uniref:formate/nitrite transporter family protein n=1 Tax=unclassified Haladaptatus TaxID=2622732 RepID=UPI00209C3AED|nr:MULTISPECIES: formate/nitrite transporter family protein [unclassified Haladaptatus]MCO8246534.1 formate/nitrite transporter family protein [Haladaptatus sp. AB643]MCO8254772.1 formate/nitrite transporter family protein [Haladaptatus sp. AB618]
MSQTENRTLTVPVNETDHVRGSDDAPVTLVEYGDFECPYCGDFYPIVRRILNRLGTRVRFVFRHFPLTEQHPLAQRAAEASEAAAAQGRFWEMYDLLYQHQDALTRADLISYAEELELDVDRFADELDRGVYEERVREDFESGIYSGANATPTFFVNGERYDGAYELEPLLEAIAEVGGLTEIQRSLQPENRELRETIDRSRRGAPAAGEAVRDRFSADEIFQRVTATADEEIERSTRLLFFSGLAAGLSIGATFLARAAMTTAYPDSVGMSNLLYPVGFVMIVIGSYQLFTENTLTPVTLVLTRLASLPQLLRLWTIVLAANVIGAGITAYLLATTGIFDPAVAATASHFGEHAMGTAWWALFYKGVFAGGLVATMVWLVHAARETISRLIIIYAIMIIIPIADLFHCVVGACEVLFLVFIGIETLGSVFFHFFVPVVLGNTLGGIVFVALVNFSMTENRRFPEYDRQRFELPWADWLFGSRLMNSLRERDRENAVDDRTQPHSAERRN